MITAGSMILSSASNTGTSSVPYHNSHLSPLVDNVSVSKDIPSDSDSDLSDVNDVPNIEASSSPCQPKEHSPSEDDHRPIATPESSDNDDEHGSEDADFDMDTYPLERRTALDESSSSHDSRRPAKRKAEVEDEAFIMNNPELYGLRRSVRPLVNSLQAAVAHEML